jgi:hypothetical protein
MASVHTNAIALTEPIQPPPSAVPHGQRRQSAIVKLQQHRHAQQTDPKIDARTTPSTSTTEPDTTAIPVIKNVALDRPVVKRRNGAHRRKPTVPKFQGEWVEKGHKMAEEPETKSIEMVELSHAKDVPPPLPSAPLPPRSDLHRHSSCLKNVGVVKKTSNPSLHATNSFLSPIKFMKDKVTSMGKMLTNTYGDDSEPDTDTDSDSDSETEDDEEEGEEEVEVVKVVEVYEVDEQHVEQLDFTNGGKEEKEGEQKGNRHSETSKTRKPRNKGGKRKKGGRGAKPIGGYKKNKKKSTSVDAVRRNNTPSTMLTKKQKQKQKRKERKTLKLLLYRKAESGMWDEMSGNVKPRMSVKNVVPYTKSWKHYYKCSCVYSSFRLFIVLVLALVGGMIQVFPIPLMFTPALDNMRTREMILDFQFSILTTIAITLCALNKWRFKGIGVIMGCMLVGLSLAELMEPEHYCYSLLGGGPSIHATSNYTTALDTVQPGKAMFYMLVVDMLVVYMCWWYTCWWYTCWWYMLVVYMLVVYMLVVYMCCWYTCCWYTCWCNLKY